MARRNSVLPGLPWWCLVLACALLVSAIGCDPSVSYRPTDWNEEAGGWTTTRDGLELRTRGVGGLAGAGQLTIDFDVHNRKSKAVVFEAARLTTKGKAYDALITASPEWWTVRPMQRKNVSFYFKVADDLFTSVGDSVELLVTARTEDGQQETYEFGFARM
jgi:hypothetical protein